jgi:hypothetical protein
MKGMALESLSWEAKAFDTLELPKALLVGSGCDRAMFRHRVEVIHRLKFNFS